LAAQANGKAQRRPAINRVDAGYTGANPYRH